MCFAFSRARETPTIGATVRQLGLNQIEELVAGDGDRHVDALVNRGSTLGLSKTAVCARLDQLGPKADEGIPGWNLRLAPAV